MGIDLTGSEKKPSNWCFLKGKTATTCRLRTNQELVAHTIAARPATITIDTPLSLPLGRLSDGSQRSFGGRLTGEVVNGRRAPLAIRCQLPVTPHFGEGLDLDFVSGATGGRVYYVDRIASKYTKGSSSFTCT